jgi:peptidylprolyl isomerase
MVRSSHPTLRAVRICCLLFLCLSVIIPLSLTQAQESNVKSTTVVLETNQGNIELTLYPDKAPKAVENFVGLVKKGYYDGLLFHRVIKGFMIQGGDPTGTGSGGTSIWGTDFADEINPDLSFDKPGILAMANRGPDTNGSQFFITTAVTTWLNGHYTIFGAVSNGYDSVAKIESSTTGQGDRPVQDQKIIKAYIK